MPVDSNGKSRPELFTVDSHFKDLSETEKEAKPPTARQKAKKAASLGVSFAEKFLKAREESKARKAQMLDEIAEGLVDPVGNKALAEVEIGASPTLKDLGVRIGKASDLLTGEHFNVPQALSGTDSAQSFVEGRKEILDEPRQSTGSGAIDAQRRLDLRKSKIRLGSISNRNPELFDRPGAAGVDNTESSLIKQIKRRLR